MALAVAALAAAGFRAPPAGARPVVARWIPLGEHGARPVPTAAQQRAGFILFTRSVLQRIYQSTRPLPREVCASIALQAARDEYEPAQVAVYPLRDLRRLTVGVSDLTDASGHVLPSSAFTVRMVRYYGARLSVRAADRFGVVPKTLEPAVPIDLVRERVRPYWITVHVPRDQPGGVYTGRVSVTHATGTLTLPLRVDVLPVTLREPDILYGTLCMGAFAQLAQGGTAAMHRADLIARDQRRHGMNALSLRAAPLYRERNGHPYLPDLEAAMSLYRRYGFSKPLLYCAGPLFKTEKIKYADNYTHYRGAVQLPIARRVAAYYDARFRDAGLPGVVFIPVDEPNRGDGIAAGDAPQRRQQIAAELARAIKAAGGRTALTCTPESLRCAPHLLDYWIVAFSAFHPALYGLAQTAHVNLAVYANAATMGQGTYFPRFLFGYFAWANGLKGVVPWTYPLQPRRFPRNVGGAGEGGLHVVDGFLGIDGTPIPTIQWELAREGIDDAKYLVTIEALAATARRQGSAAGRHAAAAAERFLAGVRAAVGKDLRHYRFEDARRFEPRPVDDWNAAKFAATRHAAVRVLKQLLRCTT